MERIDKVQLFELFLQTLECCGTFLLNCALRDIEYFLFEEFDGDSISFLHETSLSELVNCGYISPEINAKCQLLYKRYRQMEGTSMWNANSVKEDPEWHAILSLSDEIKSALASNASRISPQK